MIRTLETEGFLFFRWNCLLLEHPSVLFDF